MTRGLSRPRPTGFGGAGLVLALALFACGGTDLGSPTGPAGSAGPNFISNGVPTGSDFGSVGANLFDFDGDGIPDGGDCTGSLISPTVFLLAAHCVSAPGLGGECFLPASRQFVTFVPDLFATWPPPDLIRVVECHADPQFTLGSIPTDFHDLAVLILPEGSTAGKTPYTLPPAGLLDELAAHGGLEGQLVVNVGYGIDATQRGRPRFSFDGVRKTSKSRFSHLLPNWLVLLINSNATGEGGACFIDSGSPHFLEGRPGMAVAVTTWGINRLCRAQNGNYRLDTPSARAFLGQFVSLP